MNKKDVLSKTIIALILSVSNSCLIHAQPAAPLSMSYGPLLQFSTGSRPSDVAVGDFDHDGRPDIAVTQRGHDTLAIFRQLPGNTFPVHASIKYYVPSGPNSLVSLPLNGYGPSSASPSPPADDLAVGCATNAFFYLFDNMSTTPGVLSLVPRPFFLWQNGSSVPLVNPRLVTGHFNSANYFDIGYLYDAMGPRGLGGMAMLGNNTTTNPQPRIHYSTRVTPSPNFMPVDFSLADIQNRGQVLDAIMPSPATNEIIAILRQVPLSYNSPWWSVGSASTFPSFGARPVSAAAADVNGDGGVDVVAAHEGSLNLVVQFQDPTSPFALTFSPVRLTYPLLDVPRKILLADLNADNKPELLVLLENGGLLIYRNTGQSGQGLFDLATGATMVTHTDATYMRLTDLNLDGRPDIIVTCQGDDTVNIFYGASPLPAATTTSSKSAIEVYPNPTHHTVRVELPAGIRNVPLTLLDAMGRTVRYWPESSSVLLLEGLPRGVYTLRVVLPEGPATRRIVLE
jgi:hypothetical protein